MALALTALLATALLLLAGTASAKKCTVDDVRSRPDPAGPWVWDFTGCVHVNALGARLNDDDVEAMAARLEGDANTISIDLSQNFIGDRGAVALSALLEHRHTKLSHLWLASNRIGCGGIKAIAEAIRENVELVELHLGRNHIHADGATALASALSENTKLEVLDIQHNAFHYRGTAALATALEKNKKLRRLNIGFNRIGDVGARKLANGLRKNKVLTSISLRANGIGEGGMHDLARELRRNRHIVTIDVSHNNASPDAMHEVSKLVHKNEARWKKKKMLEEAEAEKAEL